MSAWHGTYANLLRTRFSALVAYAEALVDSPGAARDLAEDASVAVFARRKAPRDTQQAELAAREWMAAKAVEDGVDPEHVAAILIAIDGRDEAGVKAILKKATPSPLPEVAPRDADAIRRRFAESAAIYSTPSGGVNTVMEPARRRHRSAMAGAAGGTLAAVAAVAVAGWFGLNHLPNLGKSAEAPSASASPSATGLLVTWNPEPDYKEAVASFHYPKCGETFAPSAEAVGGVTPSPKGTPQTDATYGDSLLVADGFASDDGKLTPLLAAPNMFVATLDDKVVYTVSPEYWGMSFFAANTPNANGSMIGFSASNLCDAQVAAKALSEKMQGLSDDDQTKMWDLFAKEWRDFPPGTYKIYQVTPMVFGEQAALGQAFAVEGVMDTWNLSSDISYTKLAEDPRVAPYCTGSWDVGDFACKPPADVLKEVLTRQIDPTTINSTDPGVGISEPIEYTVP